MSKLTAKRVLRVSRSSYLTEVVKSVAVETRQLEQALKLAEREIEKAKALDFRAASKLSGWCRELDQMSADCAETLNDWMDDQGQSGLSNKSTALDNLQDTIEQYLDVTSHAHEATIAVNKTRWPKARKGKSGLVVRDARARLAAIKAEVKELVPLLREQEKALDKANEGLDIAADTDNVEVYEEYAGKIGKSTEWLYFWSEAVGLVGEQLRAL